MQEIQKFISERIYIVQPYFTEEDRVMLEEAVALVNSTDAVCAGTMLCKIREISPATFIGKGYLQKIQERLLGLDVTILFNGDLSPSQMINISDALDGKKVIDRTLLILDIFAKNAQSNEGKLQVELAQLKYMYPRLKGKGESLSRLGGGIGTRGPGESKLETDRRRIRERIAYLENHLQAVKNRRSLINDRRIKRATRRISLIGYTNAGKSTLLNLLTQSDVMAEDRLFATLDPTSRLLEIDHVPFLLADTVGFLRNLPHHLISAFHSTLESALSCDLALIVCDATSDYSMQLQTTFAVLKELNAQIPYLIVMNKCEAIQSFEGFPPNSIFISAKQNIGIEYLKNKILQFFSKDFCAITLQICYDKMPEYNRLRLYFTEISVKYMDEYFVAVIRIEQIHLGKLKKLLATELEISETEYHS